MSYPYEERQKKSYKGMKEDKGNWTCSKCHNVNWSWRIECNKCHEPAPEDIVRYLNSCNYSRLRKTKSYKEVRIYYINNV